MPAAAPGEARRPGEELRQGSLTYRDPRLIERLPARAWRMFLPRVTASRSEVHGPLRDPKYNAEYPFRLQVLCLPEERNGQSPDAEPLRDTGRRFVVHFMKAEDEVLARRVGSVMARLYWLGVDYLKRGPTEARYVNIWLSRDGKAGGEEFRGNIFLYAVLDPRAPAEWVRELAHEYGHVILPRMGPYREPEPWASGYFAERLFMKWMLLDNGLTRAWDRPIDGAAYVANQVAPLRDRFRNEGPASTAARGLGSDGMDFFIGQMMALEEAHGPLFIRSLLDRFATPHPQNLPLYLAAVLRDTSPLALTTDGAAFIPSRTEPATHFTPEGGPEFRKAAYWLYLPAGDLRISLRGGAPAGTAATLAGTELLRRAASEALEWDVSIPASGAGWRRLDLAAPPGATLKVQALVLTRP